MYAQTNTFQCVLASDGSHSFVIFLYADDGIQWTTGDASGGINGTGGTPAQAGFDAGNTIDFTVIEGSFTDDIINIEELSNVNWPGMFVFQVNGKEVSTSDEGKQIDTLQSVCHPHCSFCMNATIIIIHT